MYKKKKPETKKYQTKDLIELSDEFYFNRDFDSWKEVFYNSLQGNMHHYGKKHYTYEQIAKRFPKKIIEVFLDLLCKDLIENETEFIFNPRAKEFNRYGLKMGYIKKANPKKYHKNTRFKYSFAGVQYILRVIQPIHLMRNDEMKLARFGKKYREMVIKELKKGRRYFNSYKEKILHKSWMQNTQP